MEQDNKKKLQTILVILLVVVGVGFALFSGFTNLMPPKEEIISTIPPGPGGGGMRDAERGGAEAPQASTGKESADPSGAPAGAEARR